MNEAELAQQAAATDEDMFNNFLSAIKEEKASLRVNRPNNLGCLDTCSFGADTTAKIADRIASLLQEAADTKRILGDPVTVHLNMLSGTIAKISMENCAHVHGIQFNDLEAAEAALASRLEQNETLTGQLAAAMEEIASLKQSLAEAEGQIRHLEQRISGLGKIANADRAIQAAAKFWNEMILKHFRQREDRPGYEIDWNEIGEALAKALLAAEERGAKAERAAWTECTRDLGPLIAQAKADGVLDTLIEANIWPLPATCITDADVLHSIEVAIAIRPDIEAEQCARGQWQTIDTANKWAWEEDPSAPPILVARFYNGRMLWMMAATYGVATYGDIHCASRAGWRGDTLPQMAYGPNKARPVEWIMDSPTHWQPLPPLPSPQEGE